MNANTNICIYIYNMNTHIILLMSRAAWRDESCPDGAGPPWSRRGPLSFQKFSKLQTNFKSSKLQKTNINTRLYTTNNFKLQKRIRQTDLVEHGVHVLVVVRRLSTRHGVRMHTRRRHALRAHGHALLEGAPHGLLGVGGWGTLTGGAASLGAWGSLLDMKRMHACMTMMTTMMMMKHNVMNTTWPM